MNDCKFLKLLKISVECSADNVQLFQSRPHQKVIANCDIQIKAFNHNRNKILVTSKQFCDQNLCHRMNNPLKILYT